MENKNRLLKKFLFATILVVLLLPLLQQHLKFYESEKLHGAIVPKQQAWFSFDAWWNGDYQHQHEEWFNENFGFRNDLVRIHNQIAYSAFNKAKANGVVIGKEDYLYEMNYIKAYTGQDFLGMSEVNTMADRIKLLQDSLAAKGKTLIVCFAAGKATFFPEYIPDSYGPASDSTNYKMLSKALVQNNVNVVDFNKWFLELKPTAEYPLYGKTGIHWSHYGGMLAFDSLHSYIEHKRNADMPDVVLEGVDLSDTLRVPDGDIGLAMNLLWPVKHYAMGYHRLHFEDTVGKAHVRVMAITDSYFWQMFNLGLSPTPFDQTKFYYYNKEVFTYGQPMMPANYVSMVNDVESSDVVILMATEGTLFGLGWGFIDDAFNHFVLHRAIDETDLLIQKYESLIRMDDEWMKNTQIKARDNGISLDSMIFLDAKYMADQEIKNKPK